MSEGSATASRRSVLVVTFRWPPQGGGGVQRTLKFVKYLSRQGWSPVVHTVANAFNPLRDPGLLAEVPASVPVYRTPTIELEGLEVALTSAASSAAGRLRGRAKAGGQGSGPRTSSGTRVTAAKVAAPPADGASPGAPGEGPGGISEREARMRRGGLVARIRDRIWSRLLVPDPQIVWLPGAYLRSTAIARQHGCSVIYTTAPPQSLNVLGLALERALHLPWVADLRDPWTSGLHRNQWYPDNPRRQAREERWERAIFERAAHVIVVNDAAREEFLAKYPFCPPDRISVITNGFDPADFRDVSPKPRFLEPGLLHVTLTGHVETLFDLVPLFEAVHQAVEARPEDRATLRLNFVGTRRMARYDEWIAARGLGDVIRYRDYVPHADSVQILSESQVLMLCMTPVKEYGAVKILGKMCEYLYTRKPVLALTIPGVTSQILENAGVGITLDPGDVAGMRDTVRRLLDEFRGGGIRVAPNEAVIATFDRERQAAHLARILEDAVARR